MTDTPYCTGDFVWSNFPERENPARPGPCHIGYVALSTTSDQLNAVVLAYTTSQPWTGPKPPGLFSFNRDMAIIMGQARAFTLDLRRLAIVPVTVEWFSDLPSPDHGVVGRAPERPCSAKAAVGLPLQSIRLDILHQQRRTQANEVPQLQRHRMVRTQLHQRVADDLADQLEAAQSRLCSAMSVWETIAGLCRTYMFSVPSARAAVQSFIALNDLRFVAIGERELDLATRAYAEYGKGRHPAALNMGDCFAYACARANRARLLFKGEDFAKTNIGSAGV